MIVAAVAALAAVTSYIVQRVVDDEIDGVEDPAVLFLDAEVAAAFVVEQAYEAALREVTSDPSFRLEDPAFLAPFRLRCEEFAKPYRFGDVVLGADLRVDPDAENPFRCELVFRDLNSL